ncbi:M91 family zinc metallopeptidase [Corallococcus macrosporus]|uniref:M91 family zinc metallopeptidase n=1 Tax=Corallococcus macrosporus TaxID=35 RepID=UPI0009E3FD84|nr:M91 family zinc metallopeptidase [Corallococcus macrosporus]
MKLRSRPSFSMPSSSSSSSRPRSNSAPPKVDTRKTQQADKTPKTEASAKPSAPRPTPSELQTGRDNLRRTDYGVVHPDLQGIRTRRDNGQSGADFADFTLDARNSTHQLTSQPNGRRMMTELDGRTQAVNPGAAGSLRNPVTVADIYSGRNAELNGGLPNAHAPRNDGTFASTRPAYRFDGQPSAGRPSNITYNEQGAGPRFNSLGHESVHAWRASNGLQVSPLAASRHADAPVFHQQPQFTGDMKQTVDDRLRLTEEFETVGLRPTPHTRTGWAPNENLIRAEHGLPLRDNYSGMRPGNNSNTQNLSMFDAGSDNRTFFQRMTGQPTPVGTILNDLER